jgi:hypothetical protein
MSIPRKQSRVLCVGGSRYRWRVRNRPTYAQALAEKGIVLAIQSADTADGAVLLATLPAYHPSNWLDLPNCSVTPALVAKTIEQALTAGWTPHCPGRQFQFDVYNSTSTPLHLDALIGK